MELFANTSKLKKTVYVAVFVSIASMVSFNFLTDVTDGFIVALSIVVMEVFLYCYEDLSSMYITVLSGIFSPFFRFVMIALQTGNYDISAARALPDTVYYLAFGITFTLIYDHLVKMPKSLRNYPQVIFLSDVIGNTFELLSRGLISGHFFFNVTIFGYVLTIGIVRTLIVVTLIAAIENYLGIIMRKERDQEYLRLIEQSTVIGEEVRLMDKNVSEVEDVMKKVYALYQDLDEEGYPEEIVHRVLDVAKNTHEIKGDYQNVIGVLKSLYDQDLQTQKMKISEIIRLVQANVLAMIRKRGLNIEVVARVQTDFVVTQSFKMMSILRNLLTNAAEAIAEQSGARGMITITVDRVPKIWSENQAPVYEISVRDNGPGIPEDELGTIFLEGYSTKFDYITGYIQRGLGLSLVKDYVEQSFNGTIDVKSTPGKGTVFSIRIPESVMNGDAGETENSEGMIAT